MSTKEPYLEETQISPDGEKDTAYTLPNGLSVFHVNQHETNFVYREIFEERIYLQHGITLPDQACVLDIGSNIGLFSLFVLQECPTATLYACEPSPELYAILQSNLESYAEQVTLVPCGISCKNTEALFTYYPQYSILSGFNADFENDFETLKSGIRNTRSDFHQMPEEYIEALIREKLRHKKEYRCQVRTLSSLIAEYKIHCIDLLKLDVEKSELDVLQGIEEADWQKIKQIVMEVHDSEGALLETISSQLELYGFHIETEAGTHPDQSTIFNLYAIHKTARQKQKTPRIFLRGCSDGTQPDSIEETDTLVIAASFTAEPLLPGVEFWKEELDIPLKILFTPYNQVFQALLAPGSQFINNRSGMNVIVLRWEDWIRYGGPEQAPVTTKGKKRTLTRNQKIHLEKTFQELLQALKTYGNHLPCATLVLLAPASPQFAANGVYRGIENKFNNGLKEHIKTLHGIDLVDACDYHASYHVGRDIFDAVSDEMGHIPYTSEYFTVLATLVMRRFYVLRQSPYKVIISDCDNTLWQGVCGEVGHRKVKIEGFHKRLQQFLVTKAQQGFLVCLASKNNAEDVWNVFDDHPDMILTREHIVDSRINWQPKSENLTSLAQTLNVSSESFIFLDDNPVECAEVRSNCPSVLTINVQTDSNGDHLFDHFWMSDLFSVTEEDKQRSTSYKANIKREKLLKESYDFQHFLNNLNLDIRIQSVDANSMQRASQLTQRTNQFNLTTYRRSVSDLQKLLDNAEYACDIASVKDRFGDYGIVGVMITRQMEDILELDTFLLSCRVLGRGIEYHMISYLGQTALRQQCAQVKIVYKQTAKNEPGKQFIEQFAAQHLHRQEGADMEFLVPADELVALQLQRPKELKETAVKIARSSSIENSETLVFSIREKEALLVKLSSEMYSMQTLARCIDQWYREHTQTRKKPGRPSSTVDETPSVVEGTATSEQIHTHVLERVKESFAKALMLATDQLDENANIETFLCDSLKIVEITSDLSKQFPTIPATLLFEYQTLHSIAGGIVAQNCDILRATDLFAAQTMQKTPVETTQMAPAKTPDITVAMSASKNQDAVAPYLTQPFEEFASDSAIAIIGIQGIFPQAANLGELWRNLKLGVSSISEIPESRWDVEFFFDKNGGPDKSYCKYGGFIDDVARFDAPFFHISPQEAEMMDPQQRLFMQVVWGLIEDAGYTPATMPQKTGVFVGVISSDYNTLTSEAVLNGVSSYRNSDYYQIPNRISYFFDFQAPSLAIDTACSSSGTAIHLACQSIQRQECHMAIVGGLNLFLHPSRFIQYAQMHVFSRDNKCRPFGADTTGTLYGEGIGAILLKPLTEAERDGDSIYAVIKASAVNSGGKTNGFTVPNPLAQAKVISKALECAGVDAGTISYVEAHGTGTPLGDPIEIRGLSEGYRKHCHLRTQDNDRTYCAIGSIKANVGHLESAAAMAGLLKIVLQMKYGMLVPSLHSTQLNPMIPFQQTPFYVQQQLEEWKRPVIQEGGKSVTYPRRAGLSSFGAGGVNAHIIFEEYQLRRLPEEPKNTPQIIILSAKNQKALKALVQRFISFIDNELSELGRQNALLNLENMAYTLQVGRVFHEERLAVIASDFDDLKEKFQRYLQQQYALGNVYSGKVKQEQTKRDLLTQGRAGVEFIKIIVAEKQIDKLAELWVLGIEINWRLLHGDKPLTRIPLPTYPFDGSWYWVPNAVGDTSGMPCHKKKPVARLHPLVESNTSTLQEQKFSVRFTGREFFLKDHVVDNKRMLPGVAYIEMARFAGNLATEHHIQHIQNIVWTRPIIVSTKACNVEIIVSPGSDGNYFYEVCSLDENYQCVPHAQGKLLGKSHLHPESDAEFLDIEAIKERCNNTLSAQDCYTMFNTVKLKYGPAFHALQVLYFGMFEGLAEIALPKELTEDFEEFVLHPVILDAAMQTLQAFMASIDAEFENLYVPFALGQVDILRPLTKTGYVYMTFPEHAHDEHAQKTKFTLQILNSHGQIAVVMRDLSIRALHDTMVKKPLSKPESPVMLYYENIWKKANLPKQHATRLSLANILIFDFDKRLGKSFQTYIEKEHVKNAKVFLIQGGAEYREFGNNIFEIRPGAKEDYTRLIETLNRQQLLPNRIIYWSKDSSPDLFEIPYKQIEKSLYSLLYLTQAHVELTPKQKLRLIYGYHIVKNHPQPAQAAMSGFVKSLRAENKNLAYRVVCLQTGSEAQVDLDSSQAIEVLLHELENGNEFDIEVLYDDEQRYVRHLEEFEVGSTRKPAVNMRKNGLYLITGGAGGLGLIFAEYLALEWDARVILVGRSTLNGDAHAGILKLTSSGADIRYLQADVSKREEVERVLATITSEGNGINGIFHCAGVIRDALFSKKQRDDIELVLAPKVHGILHIDRFTRDESLDFLILFSSTTAAFGNVGQCDYAYANSFLDSFAEMRERLRQAGKRKGKTLSINWPLWKEGGMKVDEETATLLKRTIGLIPLPTDTGIEALNIGLTVNGPQLIVVHGMYKKLRNLVFPERHFTHVFSSQPSETAPKRAHIVDKHLLSMLQKDLANIISRILKINEDDVDYGEDMNSYGFDSITMTAFINKVNEIFTLEISPAVYFEYSSLESFAGYLGRSFSDHIAEHYAETMTVKNVRPEFAPEEAPVQENIRRYRFQIADTCELRTAETAAAAKAPIAIIGISGKMPQSENLEILWEHLKAGDDLISEIPQDRWNWREYYGDPNEELNKTDVIWGGFVEHVDAFDAAFFGISRREAELMDPQQRLFLQTVWATIEDAGYNPSDFSGTKTSVFVGVTTNDYVELLEHCGTKIEAFLGTGVCSSIVSNRISYLLNISGPSESIDTACSSSLIAIRRGVESIQREECEMAIAGGVNVILRPKFHISFRKAGMLSIEGRCKTFDKDANGYVRSEGVGAILLKSLRQAEADGDHIYAVIRGTAQNHGGHAHALTAPNPNAQAEVVARAYNDAQISPETVTYIEAHGTGTSLGDPVEITGLKKAFTQLYQGAGKSLPTQKSCGIGSIKTNIGHLESAAGIAGVLKVLLCMKYGLLPKMVHFKELNPYIKLDDAPFYIVTETQPWKRLIDDNNQEIPRRAGVSSFGFGGANAHIVLEEYRRQPAEPVHASKEEPQIIVFSAMDEGRLKQYIQAMILFLEKAEPSLSSNVKPGGKAKAQTLQWLLRTAADILNVDEQTLDANEDLMEYGFDPVLLTQFFERINDQFQCEITPGIVIRHTSVRAIAEYLTQTTSHPSSVNDMQGPFTLRDLAYTLQIGREPMQARIAMLVSSFRELYAKLVLFVRENTKIDAFFKGSVRKKLRRMDAMIEDEEGQEFIKSLINNGKIEKLIELWVHGVHIDWTLLYPSGKARRIPLPTYPFAKERHWIPKSKRQCSDALQKDLKKLHPMVDRNVSNLHECCFATTVSGNEFYVQSLDSNGYKIVPRLALLEMVRATAEIAGKTSVRKISDVIWAQQVVVKSVPQQLCVSLYPNKTSVEFEVNSSNHSDNGNRHILVYAQGTLEYENKHSVVQQPERIDIETLKQRYSQSANAQPILPYAASPAFSDQGSIQHIWKDGDRLLCLINFPATLKKRSENIILHPTVIHSVLHIIADVILHTADDLCLPSRLGEVTVSSSLSEIKYITLGKTGEYFTESYEENLFDIRFLNEEGGARVTMQDLAIRVPRRR